MFTIWYLRETNYVRQDDKSDFVITAAGCDHIEANLPPHGILYKLLKAAESGNVRSATTEPQATEVRYIGQ